MKRKSFKNLAHVSKETELVYKLRYEKDGVVVLSRAMSKDLIAYVFALELDGGTEKAIVCNGKLRRAHRRRVVKAGLTAIENGIPFELEEFRRLGVKSVRFAALTVSGFDEMTGGLK